MELTYDSGDSGRRYRPDDRLDYEQVEAEFGELKKRFLRGQKDAGHIQPYGGAGGKIYFRYSDLLLLRDVTLARYKPKPSRKKRPARVQPRQKPALEKPQRADGCEE